MICGRIIIINEGRIAGEVSLKDGRVAVIRSHVSGKVDDLQESGSVYLQVRGPSDEVLDRLKLHPYVMDAQLEREDDGIGTYIVTHATEVELRPELTSTIVSGGWELLELRPLEMTLEEAFLELTREEVVSE